MITDSTKTSLYCGETLLHLECTDLQLFCIVSHEIVVLSHNKITEIDVATLSQLVKLQLSHNRLKAFPDIRVF